MCPALTSPRPFLKSSSFKDTFYSFYALKAILNSRKMKRIFNNLKAKLKPWRKIIPSFISVRKKRFWSSSWNLPCIGNTAQWLSASRMNWSGLFTQEYFTKMKFNAVKPYSWLFCFQKSNYFDYYVVRFGQSKQSEVQSAGKTLHWRNTTPEKQCLQVLIFFL